MLDALGSLKPLPTPHQREVLHGLLCWYFYGRSPIALFTGPAGVGKSFESGAFLKCLADIEGRGEIIRQAIITAPTHRATKMAMEKLRMFDLQYFQHYTCARLTGMRAKHCSKTGKEYFVPEGPPAVTALTKLIVLDEASMCNAEMHGILTTVVSSGRKNGLKMLVIGDDCQLPPVGEDNNLFFTSGIEPHFKLTEVVRHGGAILDAATTTRLMGRGRPHFKTVGDGSELFVTRDRVVFHRMLREAFSDVEHAQPDTIQALAWRNDRVAELNRHARSTLYGNDAPRFVVGELLISTSPVQQGGDSYDTPPQCNTSTYIRVKGIETDEVDVSEFLDIIFSPGENWPLLKVQWIHGWCPDTEEDIYFTVVHEDHRKDFEYLLNVIKKKILEKPEKNRGGFWSQNYFPLKHFDAPVQSACALTVHRAQGSTLDTVFIDMNDIDRAHRAGGGELVNRLAYTALTRASKRVVIFDIKSPRD